MGAALWAAPACKRANLSHFLTLKRISSNPWHSGAPGGMHDTSDGRQGLTSTIRGCTPLYRCSESTRTPTSAHTHTPTRTHAHHINTRAHTGTPRNTPQHSTALPCTALHCTGLASFELEAEAIFQQG